MSRENVQITRRANEVPTVGKDGASTVTASLKSGKYEFYCPVDGHESAGMKGTLIVK